MPFPLPFLTAVAVFAAAIGDVSVAAAIAGTFSVINTVLNTRILSKVQQATVGVAETQEAVADTRAALVAPRQLVYDHEGRPVGTVLRLDGEKIPLSHRRLEDE